jgi:hypothetical protein
VPRAARPGRPSRSAWPALVVAAPVGAAFGAATGAPASQLRRDAGGDWAFDELDPVGVRSFLDNLGRFDRNHGDAFDAELRLGTHHVACFCPAIKKASVERAARV